MGGRGIEPSERFPAVRNTMPWASVLEGSPATDGTAGDPGIGTVGWTDRADPNSKRLRPNSPFSLGAPCLSNVSEPGAAVPAFVCAEGTWLADAVLTEALTANETHKAPMVASVLRVPGVIVVGVVVSLLGRLLVWAMRRVRMGRRTERVMGDRISRQ